MTTKIAQAITPDTDYLAPDQIDVAMMRSRGSRHNARVEFISGDREPR